MHELFARTGIGHLVMSRTKTKRPLFQAAFLRKLGVADGTRTRDNRNHNPPPISLEINSLAQFVGIWSPPHTAKIRGRFRDLPTIFPHSTPISRSHSSHVATGQTRPSLQSRRIRGWGYSCTIVMTSREHVRHTHSSETTYLGIGGGGGWNPVDMASTVYPYSICDMSDASR